MKRDTLLAWCGFIIDVLIVLLLACVLIRCSEAATLAPPGPPMSDQICSVRTICHPLHPKPRPKPAASPERKCFEYEPYPVEMEAPGYLQDDEPQGPPTPQDGIVAPLDVSNVIVGETIPATIPAPPTGGSWWDDWSSGGGWGTPGNGGCCRFPSVSAPEIDSTGTVSSITLLLACLAVLLSRRKREEKLK